MALQDEGDNASACDNSSSTDNTSTAESVSTTDNISIADNVSVASHGSASTTITASHEAEELIEKLKGRKMCFIQNGSNTFFKKYGKYTIPNI